MIFIVASGHPSKTRQKSKGTIHARVFFGGLGTTFRAVVLDIYLFWGILFFLFLVFHICLFVFLILPFYVSFFLLLFSFFFFFIFILFFPFSSCVAFLHFSFYSSLNLIVSHFFPLSFLHVIMIHMFFFSFPLSSSFFTIHLMIHHCF